MNARIFRLGILFAAALLCTQGQWLNYPTPGTPRTRDGKPDLTAKTPRASNGKPDLSGVWETEESSPGEITRIFGTAATEFAVPGDDMNRFSKYYFNIFVDFKEPPYRPEILEKLKKEPLSRLPVCMP